jgi:hypothetical protein
MKKIRAEITIKINTVKSEKQARQKSLCNFSISVRAHNINTIKIESLCQGKQQVKFLSFINSLIYISITLYADLVKTSRCPDYF